MRVSVRIRVRARVRTWSLDWFSSDGFDDASNCVLISLQFCLGYTTSAQDLILRCFGENTVLNFSTPVSEPGVLYFEMGGSTYDPCITLLPAPTPESPPTPTMEPSPTPTQCEAPPDPKFVCIGGQNVLIDTLNVTSGADPLHPL